MFLLAALAIGVVLALALGGDLRRLADVRLRRGWLVAVALLVQLILFSRAGAWIPGALARDGHLGTYALLVAFVWANRRTYALWPALAGVLSNAVVIAANHGQMPVLAGAARAAGIADGANVDESARRLWMLGDVFALPRQLPLANTFSVGDVLIGFGVAAFVVLASTGEANTRVLDAQRAWRPLRAQGFRRLFVGHVISIAGDWLTLGALIGWLYGQTRSTSEVAALLLVRLVPPMLGGTLAGIVVDRLSKQRLLARTELARAAMVVIALAGALADQRLVIFAAIAVSGCLGSLSGAAIPALVPVLVPADELAAANAELGLGRNAARALGALGAGAALAAVGAPAALVVDVLTFVAAAAVYRGIRAAPAARPERTRFRVSFDGAAYLFRRRKLLVLVTAFGAATVATGLANATLPRLLSGMGLGADGYGFGMAALGLGLALGEGCVGFTRVSGAGGRWIGAALSIMAGLLALLGMVDYAPTAFLLLGAIGFVDGTTDVLFDTVIQSDAEPGHHGAIFGFATTFFTTTMVAAIALAPALNAILPPGRVLVGGAVFLLVAGGVTLAGWRRTEPLATGTAVQPS